MHVARLQAEPVHRRQSADGIAALAVPHQFRFRRGARGEIQQHGLVGLGRAVGRKGLRKIRGLLEGKPAVLLGRCTNDNANQIAAAQIRKLRNLVLCRDHHPRPAAVEPILQLVRRQQRGRGDHHHAKLHRRQHGLPERHDIAEQQQQVIATPQALRTQKIRDLVGAARQRREGEFCLPVAAGIDDPQRRAVTARGIICKPSVEPVERPVERRWIWPAETLHRRIVIGAMLEQKGARVLERRHRYVPARLRTC